MTEPRPTDDGPSVPRDTSSAERDAANCLAPYLPASSRARPVQDLIRESCSERARMRATLTAVEAQSERVRMLVEGR